MRTRYTAGHAKAMERILNADDVEISMLIARGLEEMAVISGKCDEYSIVTYDYPNAGHFSLGATLIGPRIYVPPFPQPEHLRHLRLFALRIAEGFGRDSSLVSGQELTQIANFPDPLIVTHLDQARRNLVISSECTSTMVGTARILQAVIDCEVSMARCEAPEPLPDSYSPRNKERKCGRLTTLPTT